jgi:anti-sigma B factor antagonist
MLIIEVKKNGTETVFELKGSLNENSAPDFKSKLGELSPDAKSVVFDMSGLRYISSAGLRVILAFIKQMEEIGGSLKLTHVNDSVMEVFECTGFADFLTIERD